ncbi:bacteriocin-processing peptidase [[Leptolyngbya] sp. PCC 7376]|uniref:peptidase domain-containing ABC transporter n=1 Tax=[Leptolyngbya] sp. PCC 7376 TaxID=111781 RepID=UPI00029F30C1|nr:peptidase domain-containing ABC transporter [[Leptolyngbya] sp. PCC 7376]AFY37603.1 bacteriocin-processing peptidase [[Leptolyngbya] sp. PCC 7376]
MKYQVILQHNEEDCGAACLATCAKYYGQFFSLHRVREVAGTGALGTTLLNLKQGAKTLLFDAKGVKVPLELIDQDVIPLPGIIHWQGVHWVVLYGKKGHKYIVADPAVGLRYLSKAELLKGWTNGAMLLLEPRPEFHHQLDDRRKINNYQRFLAYFSKKKRLLGQVLLLNLMIGILALTSPFLLQILTDEVLVTQDITLLNGVIIAVFISNLFRSSFRFIQSYLVTHFSQGLELSLVIEFCRSILSLPLAYYESHRSGEVASRLRDIQAVNQLVSQALILLPSQLFIALISLILIFLYSYNLLFITFIIGIVMCLSTLIFWTQIKRKTQKLLALTAENQGVLVETFKGALIMKTKNATSQFLDEFQARFGRQAKVNFQRSQIAIFNSTFSGFILRTGEAILLWFGSRLVFQGNLTIGQLVACNIMSKNALSFITLTIDFVNQLVFVQSALERLSDVIDATPEVQPNQIKPKVKLLPDSDLICHDLTFHHPGRVELLHNFNLSLSGGKAIALIGESGCGKSTLAKLIAGLYFPQTGQIRIGDYNLNDLAIDSIREQIVLIPQETHFWSRSIIENLSLGNSAIDFSTIVQACKIAQADEFISKLPNQYQTILGEFGANLSGGQRQRLALALGIVSNSPILILDESTANLDPVCETEVITRLLNHRQGKTTILISHRPQVITRADWIVFLERGTVKRQGTPQELFAQTGSHLHFLTP